ncbi:MAG: hypothetical protein HYV97_13615 [Bdellovibrio sp.]|nr:hypothetical protein [Bdellovibrio sp.]
MSNRESPKLFSLLSGEIQNSILLNFRKYFILFFSIALMALFHFGANHFRAPFYVSVNPELICTFLSLVICSSFALVTQNKYFYEKAILLSFAFLAVFIDPKFAPFALECLYTLWLISNFANSSIYLRLFNFIISILLMTSVLLNSTFHFYDSFLQKMIIICSFLRYAFVNYKYFNDSSSIGFEDVVFSALSLLLISKTTVITSSVITVVFIPILLIAYITKRPQQKFGAALVWQYFILTTSGIIQAIAIPMYLVGLRQIIGTSQKHYPSHTAIMAYAFVLMLFLIKGFTQQTFPFEIIDFFALHWIFWNAFFVRILYREFLHITLIIFIIYLFY